MVRVARQHLIDAAHERWIVGRMGGKRREGLRSPVWIAGPGVHPGQFDAGADARTVELNGAREMLQSLSGLAHADQQLPELILQFEAVE